MATIKPQTPLILGDNNIFPLTTIDQVIDGDKRLNATMVKQELTGVVNGVTALTNADMVNGKSAKELVYDANTYSTDEIRIGTWINGKPIYRKVYSGTYTSGTTLMIHSNGYNELLIDTLTNIYAVTDKSNPRQRDYYYASADYLRPLFGGDSPNNLILNRGSNYPVLPFNYSIVLEYTKTTD